MNDLINVAKGPNGARKYNQMKDACERSIAFAIRQAKIAKISGPCSVRFVWLEKNKRRDKDNIAGGGEKFVMDALRACGIIKNDGWNDIDEIHHEFRVEKVFPGVLVTLISAE